jgi:ABC-2 type transport system ATP-binding protein
MIEIQGVTKRYGTHVALDNLTLSIGPGEVFGFIGPNGAGKTTTMKILACLIAPDQGRASVCGLSVHTHADQIRLKIGYMPDFLGYYDDLTCDEYLQFFAAAFRIPRARRRSVIDGVLELTDLREKRDTPVEGLSRGMQQRLGVARVLLHDPAVLLLDEPASGLDPRARIELRGLLTELRRMGKTLMVSSHILTELGEMSTSIGIIERGKLIFAGSLTDALSLSTRDAKIGERILITLEPTTPTTPTAPTSPGDPATPPPDTAAGLAVARALDALAHDPRVARAVPGDTPNALVVDLAPGEHGHHFLIERLIAANVRIAAFLPQGIKLEDAFLRLTTGAVQ